MAQLNCLTFGSPTFASCYAEPKAREAKALLNQPLHHNYKRSSKIKCLKFANVKTKQFKFVNCLIYFNVNLIYYKPLLNLRSKSYDTIFKRKTHIFEFTFPSSTKHISNAMLTHAKTHTNNCFNWNINNQHSIKCITNTRTWHTRLKSCTSIVGFKKAFINALKVRNAQLVPAINRRKHNVSHYNLITNQIKRLSKTFGYISTNKINAWIGLTLTKFSVSYQHCLLVPKNSFSTLHFEQIKTLALKKLKQKQNIHLLVKDKMVQNKYEAVLKQAPNQQFKLLIRNVPNLINLIESESNIIYWKNNSYKSLNATKQALRHIKPYKHILLNKVKTVKFKLKKVNPQYAWLKTGEVLRQ